MAKLIVMRALEDAAIEIERALEPTRFFLCATNSSNDEHRTVAWRTTPHRQVKPCRARPFGLHGELESESQDGNPG